MSTAYLRDFFMAERNIFLCKYKFENVCRILCWFVRCVLGDVHVRNSVVATVVRCVLNVCIRDVVDEQERKLIFALVFILDFGGSRDSAFSTKCFIPAQSMMSMSNSNKRRRQRASRLAEPERLRIYLSA